MLTQREGQKWFVKGRNLTVGDIVMLVEGNSPRCHWLIGCVISVKQSGDGLVRSVTVKCEKSFMTRPISKLILLCENDGN